MPPPPGTVCYPQLDSKYRFLVGTELVSDTIAGVNDFANRTRLGTQHILQAVGDLNAQAAALQEEARLFVERVRAA